MSRVVDTDVVSYLYKGDSRADLYYPHLFGQILVTSFQTIAELRRWMLSANWGARRRQHLESFAEVCCRALIRRTMRAVGRSNGERETQRATHSTG